MESKSEEDHVTFENTFESGVRFAESELKMDAIRLLHYYRHTPLKYTQGKSNEEIFDMWMKERSEK